MLHQVNKKGKKRAVAPDDQRMVTRRKLLANHSPAGDVGVTVSSEKATEMAFVEMSEGICMSKACDMRLQLWDCRLSAQVGNE